MQIGIQRLAADAELACQVGFLLTSRNPLAECFSLLSSQGRLAATVHSRFLGHRNTFALPLSNQRPLELDKARNQDGWR